MKRQLGGGDGGVKQQNLLINEHDVCVYVCGFAHYNADYNKKLTAQFSPLNLSLYDHILINCSSLLNY